MTRYRRVVITLAAVAVFTSACNGDDDGAGTTVAVPTTEETTTTTEPTTTVPQTTTALATTTTLPPTTDTTVTPPTTTAEQIDWIAVVEDVYARQDALLAEPADPARAGEVAEEASPSHEELVKILTDYNANGWHNEVDPFEAVRVDLVSVTVTTAEGAPRVVRLTVWLEPRTGRGLIDSGGNVVGPPFPFDGPPGTLPRLSVALSRVSLDSPWRLVDAEEIPPEAP